MWLVALEAPEANPPSEACLPWVECHQWAECHQWVSQARQPVDRTLFHSLEELGVPQPVECLLWEVAWAVAIPTTHLQVSLLV